MLVATRAEARTALVDDECRRRQLDEQVVQRQQRARSEEEAARHLEGLCSAAKSLFSVGAGVSATAARVPRQARCGAEAIPCCWTSACTRPRPVATACNSPQYLHAGAPLMSRSSSAMPSVPRLCGVLLFMVLMPMGANAQLGLSRCLLTQCPLACVVIVVVLPTWRRSQQPFRGQGGGSCCCSILRLAVQPGAAAGLVHVHHRLAGLLLQLHLRSHRRSLPHHGAWQP